MEHGQIKNSFFFLDFISALLSMLWDKKLAFLFWNLYFSIIFMSWSHFSLDCLSVVFQNTEILKIIFMTIFTQDFPETRIVCYLSISILLPKLSIWMYAALLIGTSTKYPKFETPIVFLRNCLWTSLFTFPNTPEFLKISLEFSFHPQRCLVWVILFFHTSFFSWQFYQLLE